MTTPLRRLSEPARGLVQSLVAGFESCDPATVASQFRPDGELSWQSGETVTSRRAIRASLCVFFDGVDSLGIDVCRTTAVDTDAGTTVVVEGSLCIDRVGGDSAAADAIVVVDCAEDAIAACRLSLGTAVSVPETDSEGPTPEAILDTAFGFFESKALFVAVQLGIFTELARTAEPQTGEALAARLDLDQRATVDLLDALTAAGFLRRTDGQYRNTPATERFLDDRQSSSLCDLLRMADDRMYQLWGRLETAVRTGEPQNELAARPDQESVFEAMYEDDDKRTQFLRAMSALTDPFARAVVDQFTWERHDRVCDLGTAEGMFLHHVVRRVDDIEAVGVDLPPVRRQFESFAADRGLTDRLTFRGLDFFEEPLPSADVYVLGHVLSDWPERRKRDLLQTVYDTLPPGGAVVVYGPMIDPDRRHNEFALLMSLNMLLDSADGREYTTEECRTWLQEVGFEEVSLDPLPGAETVAVGRKESYEPSTSP